VLINLLITPFNKLIISFNLMQSICFNFMINVHRKDHKCVENSSNVLFLCQRSV